MAHYEPPIIFSSYRVLTPDIAPGYDLSSYDEDGNLTSRIHPVPMLNGNFAITAGTVNNPILTVDLLNELIAIPPQSVCCCDFEDHTNYHQIVED